MSRKCRFIFCRRRFGQFVALPGHPLTGHKTRLTYLGKLTRYVAGPGASALPTSLGGSVPCLAARSISQIAKSHRHPTAAEDVSQ
jgi:hypothetical protein